MAAVVRPEQLATARVFSFADLERQGQQLIEQAKAQAREILQAAERRAVELVEERGRAAYEAGEQRGLAEGREAGLRQMRAEAHEAAVRDARDQVAALVAALTALLMEFEQNKRSFIAAAESGLIELALAIARRVCKLEAGRSSAAARENVRHLLEMVRHQADVELHVHPAEHDELQGLAPELLAQVGKLAHARIVADEAVGRGGCVLIARDGQIDATVETQLERIAAALHVGAGGAPAKEAAPSDGSPLDT